MRVPKLDFTRMRSNRHFQFHTEVRKLLKKSEIVRVKVQKQADRWLDLYDKEDEALKKIRKSEFTDTMRTADKDRDVIFRGMVEFNHSKLNYFQPEEAEAARKVQIVLDTYGNIARLSMDEKTSAYYNLVAELGTNHNEDAEKAGLAPWAEELHRRNTVFDELVSSRFSETAGRSSVVLKQIRVEVDEAYRVLTLCIEALWELATDEEEQAEFTDFILQLNAVIEHYNNLSARRGKNAATAPDVDTDSPDPDAELTDEDEDDDDSI